MTDPRRLSPSPSGGVRFAARPSVERGGSADDLPQQELGEAIDRQLISGVLADDGRLAERGLERQTWLK
jgi:hypothetical protein